jgi:hypothetical protein
LEGIFHHMDNLNIQTSERPVSNTKNEIINESKRIEECLLYSSKGHFAAAHFWRNFHLWIGIPIVLLSAIAGVASLSQFDPKHITAGILAIFVAGLSSIMTFLNPNERASNHLNAGNNYDALQNKIRIFWSIECWQQESEEVLTEKLKFISEQKDKLNHSCPQIPKFAYRIGKKGIKDGESDFEVDSLINK